MRRFFFFFALIIALLSAGYWRLSDGFSIAKMSEKLPFESRWDVGVAASPEIFWILSQPFYYIGKGSQSFVFESADHQYVLKFFRLNRYRQKVFPSLPPFLAKIQQTHVEERKKRRSQLFASCTLAYKELRDESGLVYLHLNPTQSLKINATLYDAIKRPHTIAIDDYAFLIQRKGELLYSYLGDLLKEGKTTEVKKALINLAYLLDKRVEKGIRDADPEIHKNAGFLNGKALFLDVGQFYKEEIPESRERVVRKLIRWLEVHDEKLASDAWTILIGI